MTCWRLASGDPRMTTDELQDVRFAVCAEEAVAAKERHDCRCDHHCRAPSTKNEQGVNARRTTGRLAGLKDWPSDLGTPGGLLGRVLRSH
jgi:hypothetical protein